MHLPTGSPNPTIFSDLARNLLDIFSVCLFSTYQIFNNLTKTPANHLALGAGETTMTKVGHILHLGSF